MKKILRIRAEHRKRSRIGGAVYISDREHHQRAVSIGANRSRAIRGTGTIVERQFLIGTEIVCPDTDSGVGGSARNRPAYLPGKVRYRNRIGPVSGKRNG